MLGAVQGIADLITRPGYINVDCADIRTVMPGMGMTMMGTGTTGQERARVATESAIASPLLEDIHLAGAKGILVNITAGDDLRMGEFEEVGNTMKSFASENATVVVGTVFDSAMSDEARVTVVATGIGHEANIGQETVTGKPKPVVDIDYKTLDRPTVIRKNRDKELPALEKASPTYLDIPAFLRRHRIMGSDLLVRLHLLLSALDGVRLRV